MINEHPKSINIFRDVLYVQLDLLFKFH